MVCAQREKTLCLLDLQHKVILQDAIIFGISERHITTRPGRSNSKDVFYSYLKIEKVPEKSCHMSTLEEYLNLTEPRRHVNVHYYSLSFIFGVLYLIRDTT